MYSRALPAALFLLLCVSPSLHAQGSVSFPDRKYSTLSYGGSLWIGTPRGLYRYRSEDNVWSAYGPQNGLLSSVITSLDVRNDVLWIGQDRGITAFDLRSNTMLHYDSTKGFSSGSVRATAFEEDFVWTGGARGASRYDNLIEEWQRIAEAEGLSGSTVHAIVPKNERVFLATERGVNEYDPRHERWRLFAPPDDAAVLDAFVAGGWLWLLRDGELLRFDMDARVFSPYPLKELRGSDVREIIVSGSGFWLVTAADLWQYDSAADALRPFLEIEQLPDRDLRAVALSGDGYTFWFSTASGVTRFVRGTSSWTWFTEASGLPAIDVATLFPLGDGVVTFSDEALFYYLPQDDRWYSFPLLKTEESGGTRFSLDPSAGSYADFGGGVRLDLSGSRSAWLFQDPFGRGERTFGEDPATRNDLKARLDLGGGRRFSATYNDSDYEDVVYGAEYRGARDDALQSLQWGDMRLEQGGSLLQQSLGIFGVGGRAVYGDRSDRYGRSLLEVTAASGHKTTASYTEVFQGRYRTQESTVTDAMWLRRVYYSLRADRRLLPMQAGKAQLYRTLYPNETRGVDDLVSTAIAGVVADWRPFKEGSAYVVDREHSVLKLLGENGGEVLAVRFSGSGTDGDLLLCDRTSQYLEIRNRYDIGQSILPSTLRLRFVDPTGSEVSLSRFGLDDDNDGHIDPEFMDHAQGELRFPDDRPFPSGAYETPGIASYTMHVEYESYASTSFPLKKRRILRGSERVSVDGLPVSAGEDYILDYTSGYLVFTRDGAVLDDSRVEISYEYIRNEAEERVSQAGVTYSPSDYTQASVTGGVFHEENSAVQTRFIQGGGELRWQSDALDVRLRPEYRHTSSDTVSGSAAGISAAVSTPDARLSLQSTIRSDGYREALAGSYAYGRLASDHALKGEYDILDELRLFATHRQREGVDTLSGAETDDRTSSAGLQWLRQNYPSITLRGEYLTLHDVLGERRRRGGRLDATWIPSAGLLDASGFHSARLSGYARLSEEQVTEERGMEEYRTHNYFMRALLSPRALFSINAWYQGDARERRDADGAYGRDYQTDRLYFDVLTEHLRGLSLGGRLTRDVRQMSTSASLQDRQTATSVQTNVRLAPGTWVDALQPFTLYASVMYNHGSYHRQDGNASGLFSSFFTRPDGRASSLNSSTYYETRLEWRPTPVILYSAIAIQRQFHSETWNSAWESQFWQLLQRVDYRPDSRLLYGMQFNLRRDDGNSSLPAGWTYEPSLWNERRISRALLLRLTLNAAWRENSTPYAALRDFRIDPAGSLTLSLEDIAILRRLEFRVDGGYSYTWLRAEYYFAPTSTTATSSFNGNFYLDLYPHPVLFIRFRYFLRWRSDVLTDYRILGLNGWSQPDAELQIVMQL